MKVVKHLAFLIFVVLRRGVRVADRASLESLCTARYRGFESPPLRQIKTRGHNASYKTNFITRYLITIKYNL